MEDKTYKQNLPTRIVPDVPPKLFGAKKYKPGKYHQTKIVPKEYQKAVKALKLLDKQGIPIENTINPKSSVFTDQEAYYLAQKTLKRIDQINYILDKLEILKKNKILNPWLARVIVTEMLYCRHQYARSLANDIETLKFYEESMRDIFLETITLVPHKSDVKFPVYIRINTLSISFDDCIRAFFKEGWNLLPRCETYDDYLNALRHLEGKNFMRDFHISELLVFAPDTIFYEHPGYLRGKFLIQDKGSCLSSFLLNPKPGSVVLDINAAPGLKTNHLANIMNNEGLIIANDDHPLRLDALRNLIELTNAKCVETCQVDQFDLFTSVADPEEIRYILIDPTCSYSGLFHKSKKNSSKIRLQRIGFKTAMLVRYCLQTFPKLKRLVFTSCSIYPEEGEKVVSDTLEEIGDSYTLLDVKEMLWNEWKNLGDGCGYLYNQYNGSEKCLRTVPERDLTPGYFIAVFERNFEVPVPPYKRKYVRGSKTYYAEELEQVEKVKRSGKVVKTYVPKAKLETERLAATQDKKDLFFAKAKNMVQYQNKVEKAAFIKNKINQPPGNNKYKYISSEYKKKQQQQSQLLQQESSQAFSQQSQLLQQESSQAFSQQNIQPSFLQKNPKPFLKKKATPQPHPALVSYPILNKLKEQQFSQQPQSQYSQAEPQAQYSQQQQPEPHYSKTELQLHYSQPKLQSQFSASVRHQQLGLVSYPIFNKLMARNKFYEDEEEDDFDTSSNQFYP